MEASAFAQFSELNPIHWSANIGRWFSQRYENVSWPFTFRSVPKSEPFRHQKQSCHYDWNGQPSKLRLRSDAMALSRFEWSIIVQRFTRKTCPCRRQSDKATLKSQFKTLHTLIKYCILLSQLVGYGYVPVLSQTKLDMRHVSRRTTSHMTCSNCCPTTLTTGTRIPTWPTWYMSRDVTSHKYPKGSSHDLSCPRCIDGKMCWTVYPLMWSQKFHWSIKETTIGARQKLVILALIW